MVCELVFVFRIACVVKSDAFDAGVECSRSRGRACSVLTAMYGVYGIAFWMVSIVCTAFLWLEILFYFYFFQYILLLLLLFFSKGLSSLAVPSRQ